MFSLQTFSGFFCHLVQLGILPISKVVEERAYLKKKKDCKKKTDHGLGYSNLKKTLIGPGIEYLKD